MRDLIMRRLVMSMIIFDDTWLSKDNIVVPWYWDDSFGNSYGPPVCPFPPLLCRWWVVADILNPSNKHFSKKCYTKMLMGGGSILGGTTVHPISPSSNALCR